jgi:ABC-type dipeptide/oligopeptide/nickel transport system permease component
MIALIFFEALAIDLGQEGNLQALPSAIPSAAVFTADYLKGLLHGDLRVIASDHRAIAGTPVADDLGRALPKSLGLLAFALTLGTPVGLILGISASLRRANRFSGLMLFGSVLGTSTPSFFAAMLLIWFAGWLYQTTGRHIVPISGFGWDAHLILPALVLTARPRVLMGIICPP